MDNISKIKISGTSYSIKDENACKVVELTQAQYDDLPTTAKTSNSLFVITDATAGDLSNYYTKSETSGATEISTALESKADTATTYTKTETDNAITAATSTKQDTLVSGTNIKTINSQSILGEGNITIEGGSGGGKAIEAGRGISITTGETADTVSFNLPISAGTGTDSIIIGYRNPDSSTWDPIASGKYSIASGAACKARGENSLAFGYYNDVYGNNDVASGEGNKRGNNRNTDAFAFGISNTIKSDDYVGISARAAAVGGFNNIVKSFVEFGVGNSNNTSYSSNTFGDSGNTLFSVGNGDGNPNVSQTTIHRHNAFEIRQNGDIYIADTNDTSTTNYYEKPMIKLQDALGGGGGSTYTAGDGIDITNDVISVTGKVDTSAITTTITSSSTDAQVPSAKAVYDMVGNINTILESI